MDYISQTVFQHERPEMEATIIRYKTLPSVVRLRVGNMHIEVCGEYNLRQFQEKVKLLGDHIVEALLSHDAYPRD